LKHVRKIEVVLTRWNIVLRDFRDLRSEKPVALTVMFEFGGSLDGGASAHRLTTIGFDLFHRFSPRLNRHAVSQRSNATGRVSELLKTTKMADGPTRSNAYYNHDND
jgi:hypothetical protein